MRQAIGGFLKHWRKRRRRRAAIGELRTLNDRTLKDMGLTRGEIIAAVDGRVYRNEPARACGPEPPVEAVDAAGLHGHLQRARDLRARFVVGLLQRGLRRLARRLTIEERAP